MGVDLRLIPITYDTGGPVYPRVQLDLDRDSRLWEAISRDLAVKPLGRDLYDLDEEKGLVKRDDDPYGSKLTMATAHDLAVVLEAWIAAPPIHGVGHWTRASGAFLAQLPPDTGVILWWH